MRREVAGLVLRAAREADADAINAMANLPGVRHGTLRLPFTPVAGTRALLAADNPNRHMIVAVLEGVPVALLTLTRGAGRTAHKAGLGMWVHDDHTGRGIGAQLLAAALDLCDNWLALRRVELEVFADNAAALHLYAKHGFVREGVKRAESLRNGLLEDVVMMARLIEAPAHRRSVP